MTKELTQEEKAKIQKEKEKTLKHYQHKLDIFRKKIDQWDADVATKKSSNGQRMWREGKIEMDIYEKRVLREIDRVYNLPEEDWKSHHDHLEAIMDKFINVYNQAVAKIRYDNPGQNLSDKVFKQWIP